MQSIFRLIIIFHTLARYRLDRLLKESSIARRFRVLLFPFWFYPGKDLSRGAALRLCLEELGPIFVKFGQLLSTRPDLVPEDIIEELNYLQDRVTPFDGATFKSLVELSLGKSTDDLFAEFSIEPLASASVAQVHTARLHSGEDVVVKIIRPGIDRLIAKDTALLMLIAGIIERISPEGRRLRVMEVVEDYRHTIFDELNLAREAANASQLRRNFTGSNMLYVPEVYWDYCNKNIMVMERIDGTPVTHVNALKERGTDLKLLAERGVEVFFTQVFEHNFFHADMHPGNVFVSKNNPQDPKYMAVDMAIIGSLSEEDQYYLARNLLAMFRRDYRQVAELHVSSGWVPPDTSISGFESAIRTVCEPIFEKPLKDISFGESLITLFQTARRFNMPVQPQLVLLQKTLLNIEGLGRQLYPELNLWDTAHPYLEKWIKRRYSPKAVLKKLKYQSPDWIEKAPLIPDMVFDALKQYSRESELKAHKSERSRSSNDPAGRRKSIRTLVSAALVIAGAWGLAQGQGNEQLLASMLVGGGLLGLVFR